MNTPFLLLGAAILFWGWQTGQWVVAAVCALVLEGARFLPRRWELAPELLSRISDLCMVLTGLLFAALYVALGNPRAVTQSFQWLPLTFLPLALAQAYGTQREIELGVLFWSMRRLTRRRPVHVNIGYAYALAWVVAAATANRREPGFELGAIVLAAWALWQIRPRSRPVAVWLLLMTLAGGLAYAGQTGLRSLQLWLEAKAPEWIRGDGGAETNPYRADTDLGHIGELKQSERIVMRVRTGSILSNPLLLHRASYVNYTGLRWLAKGAVFTPVVRGDTVGDWPLGPEVPGASLQTASIVEESTAANPVLSLPAGTRRLEGLAASEMKRNTLGTVQVEYRPGIVAYRALYVPGAAEASAPNADDLGVPPWEAEVLQQVVTALGLKRLPPHEALAAVERYFADHFTYSLYRPAAWTAATPLAEFLQRSHAGHCEYFATATVLVLRAAGIPARYATGFSVQEWSDFESAYLVRERHAHAWARVWIDGAWRDVDTTPPVWGELEAQATPWWSTIADRWSWLRLKFSELRSHEDGLPLTWIGLAGLVVLWVAWRLIGRAPKAARVSQVGPSVAATDFPGSDSAFYRIEEFLAGHGSRRAPGETMRDWLVRIRPHLPQLMAGDELAALMDLHYRCRFDPDGLTPAERSAFAARVDAWLAHAR